MNIYIMKIGDIISEAYMVYNDALLAKEEINKKTSEEVSIHCVKLYGIDNILDSKIDREADFGSYKF